MPAHGIKLPNGRLIPWEAFRSTMMAPPPRSQPAGALDAAMPASLPLPADRAGRRAARDQHPRTQTGGEPAPLGELPAGMVARELGSRGDQTANSGLSHAYVKATNDFLLNAGVAPEDVDQVIAVLAAYLDPNDGGGDNTSPAIQPLSGARAFAGDWALDALHLPPHLRPLQRPMTERQVASYNTRFPNKIERI